MQHGFSRRQRHEAALGHRRARKDFVCGLGNCLRLCGNRGSDRRHHLILPVDQIGIAAIGDRRNEAEREIICRAADRWGNRCLGERTDDAGQRHRFGRKLVGARGDQAGGRDQRAHRFQPLLPLLEKLGHLLARTVDIGFERFHLPRHLGQKLHDASRSRRAGQ
ncbi:hypothetical protein D3C73_450440 [compost metagenome]